MPNYWGLPERYGNLADSSVLANYEWLSKDLYEVYVEVNNIGRLARSWEKLSEPRRSYWREIAGQLVKRGH